MFTKLSRPRRGATNLPRGFTLIEVMIVVVIVAVLGAIALPMYRDQVVRTRRSDAMNELMQFANRQESFFSTNLVYATVQLGLPFSTDFYLITLPTVTATQYAIVANPLASKSQGGNGKLRIWSDGRKEWDKANDDSYGYDWGDR